MVRIDKALRHLDRIGAPDVWPEIERRSTFPDKRVRAGRFARPLVTAALAIGVIGGTGVALVVALSVVQPAGRPASPTSGAEGETLIAFVGSGPAEPPGLVPSDAAAGGGQHIFVVHDDGTGLRRLTFDQGGYYSPAWAPDGSRLAFARMDPTGDPSHEGIYVVNADGTGLKRVHGPTEATTVEHRGWTTLDISWSPTGDRLAFVKLTSTNGPEPGLPMELAIVPVGGGAEDLLEHPAQIMSVDWSSAGEIAFTEQRPANGGDLLYDILVTDPDGANVVRLTDDGRSLGPEWSPDARRIAFERYPRGAGLEARDIYVMNRDGKGVRRLTEDPGTETGVTWSPDGTSVLFLRYRGDACGALVELDITTGDERVIVGSGVCPGSPAWEPPS